MISNKIIVESAISTAMGAEVNVKGPGRGMYIVTGRRPELDSLVTRAGGDIVLPLDGQKMIAELPFAGYVGLRSDHRVSHIGPVSIDPERLSSLYGTLRKARSPGPVDGG